MEVESNSAFSDLKYATYLGATADASQLTTTDRLASRLLTQNAVRVVVPFGDTSITLVAAPLGHLGGSLGANLPWIVLLVGIVLTITSVFVAVQLVQRRRKRSRSSEPSAVSTATSIACTRTADHCGELQRALLPRRLPSIDNLEIASRYVAGAVGVDVGGDWYSLVQIDDQHFGFVVGDLSGRGVGAATIMAQLRYTVRAYLMEGHGPGAVLAMCSDLDIAVDGHFATVLVGVGDLGSREITLANAGHMNPLLASGDQTSFIDTAVGPPIGIGPSTYAETTVAMAPVRRSLLSPTD